MVAGWGRGLHCSGDCGRWYCKESKSETLVQTLNSADASSPPSLSTPTVQTAGTHHIEAPMIDPQARWGREEPTPHEALTANGGARFPATQSCCDIRDGDMRMQSSGATAEAVLTDFLK